MTTEEVVEGQRITSFECKGLIFDVEDRGPADGDVVVLLHGFPQTSRSWDRLAPLLHAGGYRTLAPDQRGYSPRARPRWRFAYRMSALVGDAVALIEAAGVGDRKVHVVGHDWGAAVAWTLAANRPDRVATLTALSVPHPAAFMRALFTSRQFLLSWYMYFFQLPWLPELFIRRFLKGRLRTRLIAGMTAGGQSEANVGRDADFLLESGALTPALHWYRAMPFSTPAQLARVAVPTLFINSYGDPALGQKGAALTQRYVTGPYTFQTLTGVGHWIPEEAAAEVAELLLAHLSR
jgi:pimeloyl-ACP methyl ester carboxylesterase